MAKESEAEFRKMCRKLNIWCHKWGDVRVCPRCGTKLFTSREDVPNESIIDYLMFIGDTPAWVECKGLPGHTLLPFSEIKEKQRNFLNSWMDRGVWTFLYLSLGTGNAPKGRKAWLIPWARYIEEEGKVIGRVSLPWQTSGNQPGLAQIFWQWELLWQNGGWTIPMTSPLVYLFPKILSLPSLYGENHE